MATLSGNWDEVQSLWKTEDLAPCRGLCCQHSLGTLLLLFSLISNPDICITKVKKSTARAGTLGHLLLLICFQKNKIISKAKKLWKFPCKGFWKHEGSCRNNSRVSLVIYITVPCGKESGAASLCCVRHFTTRKVILQGQGLRILV